MLAAPPQPPLDLVVTTLSNEIARLPGRFVLALDDYYTVHGEVLANLLHLVQAEVIRIIDLVVIAKDREGSVFVRELKELDPENIRILDPLKGEVTSMITRNDIDGIAAQLANNSAAGLLLIENLWAVKTKQAMLDADARVMMFERIPHEVVEENLAEMAVIGA
jgi:hypothetical protein